MVDSLRLHVQELADSCVSASSGAPTTSIPVSSFGESAGGIKTVRSSRSGLDLPSRFVSLAEGGAVC